MTKHFFYRFVFLLCAGWCYGGCKPLIYSFTVRPLTITASDSIWMNWAVRGKPTLLTHSDSTDQPGFELREYTLVVEKKRQQTKRTAIVNVLPAISNDLIGFDCVRKGDTLIAKGEKNNKRWGDHFTVQSVSSFSGRPILVNHGGRSAMLGSDTSHSSVFRGLPNDGDWEIKTLLNAAEKKDSNLIPGTLQVQTVLLFKK